MFKRILVAYDGSLLSRQALEAAKNQVANTPDSEVHIVHVMKEAGPQTNINISKSVNKELIEKYRPQLKMIEEEFKRKDILVLTDILLAKETENLGKPICKYTKDHEIDLIIMGSRGLGNLKKIFLGSVSNYIVQNVKCPVLIIK